MVVAADDMERVLPRVEVGVGRGAFVSGVDPVLIESLEAVAIEVHPRRGVIERRELEGQHVLVMRQGDRRGVRDGTGKDAAVGEGPVENPQAREHDLRHGLVPPDVPGIEGVVSPYAAEVQQGRDAAVLGAVELIVLQAVAARVVGERHAFRIQPRDAIVAAHPERSLRVGEDAVDDHVRQSVLQTEAPERPAFLVEEVQSSPVGADPQVAFRLGRIRGDAQHMIGTESDAIREVAAVYIERTRLRVKTCHAGTDGAQPQGAVGILEIAIHVVFASQDVRAVLGKEVMLPLFRTVDEPADPLRVPDPHASLAVDEGEAKAEHQETVGILQGEAEAAHRSGHGIVVQQPEMHRAAPDRAIGSAHRIHGLQLLERVAGFFPDIGFERTQLLAEQCLVQGLHIGVEGERAGIEAEQTQAGGADPEIAAPIEKHVGDVTLQASTLTEHRRCDRVDAAIEFAADEVIRSRTVQVSIRTKCDGTRDEIRPAVHEAQGVRNASGIPVDAQKHGAFVHQGGYPVRSLSIRDGGGDLVPVVTDRQSQFLPVEGFLETETRGAIAPDPVPDHDGGMTRVGERHRERFIRNEAPVMHVAEHGTLQLDEGVVPGVEPRQQPLPSPDPQVALPVDDQMMDGLVDGLRGGGPCGNGDGGEHLPDRIEQLQALRAGPDPDPAPVVLGHAEYLVVGKRGRVTRDIPVDLEAVSVVAVQPLLGCEPEEALCILQDAEDHALRQSLLDAKGTEVVFARDALLSGGLAGEQKAGKQI